MRYKEAIVGFIIISLSIAGYLGYDFFQKEKTIVIYNQDNKSVPLTFYDMSIDKQSGPIKNNLTLIDPSGDIYGINITQEISFFKGFTDTVIVRNILLRGRIEFGVYDKNTRMKRYDIDPQDVPFEKSYFNETDDIYVNNLGTSKINKSFFINIDISEVRKMAANNNFTNSIFVISYYPQLSLDVHIVDKNVKQKLSSNLIYYFHIDLDKAFSEG